MDDQKLLRIIRLLYPSARYTALAPIAAGQMEGEEAEQSFVYVSLYDHKIGSQTRPIGDKLVIINNTYLSSFAYNVGLCHLVGAAKGMSAGELARLYRHNFKKFFAEQVIYARNVLIGRSLLIETILYEQDLMVSAFAGVVTSGLEEKARQIAALASGTVSYHELMHYFEARDPQFDTRYRTEVGNDFEDIEAEALRLGGAGLRTEFRCDLAATRVNLDQQTSFSRADLLRVQLFVFYVLAELVSLTKSAAATAAAAVEEEAYIDLSSAEPPQHAFVFQIGRDPDFDARVDAQEKILARIAQGEGLTLFGDGAGFPLTSGTRAILQEAQGSIGDIDDTPAQGLTGTDKLRRGLAQILSESLKGCDQGVDFLLWRSKKFNLAGDLKFG
ncbi:MAG TPA: hypothetical protein VLR69_08895 [Thermoanaerobaculia bacterium]|jgi:hypothetical protein|nr:hypothetical protein [Thermoanaerobaculia bacterium]